jgi:hypothetical protein
MPSSIPQNHPEPDRVFAVFGALRKAETMIEATPARAASISGHPCFFCFQRQTAKHKSSGNESLRGVSASL